MAPRGVERVPMLKKESSHVLLCVRERFQYHSFDARRSVVRWLHTNALLFPSARVGRGDFENAIRTMGVRDVADIARGEVQNPVRIDGKAHGVAAVVADLLDESFGGCVASNSTSSTVPSRD